MVRTLGITFLLALVAGCAGEERSPAFPGSSATVGTDPLHLALVPSTGGDPALDDRIADVQRRIAGAAEPRSKELVDLGFLFVQRARTASRPGDYKLAEACARATLERDADHHSALLLQGHVLHALHRFAEAEVVARRLVAERELFLDLGLLGDVLLDQGDLREAFDYYQKMARTKPCLQSYSRLARVRWLRGDLAGAEQLLELAAGSGSRRQPEPLAWVYSRRAEVALQLGQPERARNAADRALELLPDYAPALLARARVDLAFGEAADAVARLRRAVEVRPLPEYAWALTEALHEVGDADGAAAVVQRMSVTGAVDDARHFALYLLASGGDPHRALALANEELAARQDVHTHDLHAWALRATGDLEAARAASERALAQGTRDGRLLYHAGVIAADGGDAGRARPLLLDAHELRHTLLPSELRDLERRLAAR